jgi:hypothetical protein
MAQQADFGGEPYERYTDTRSILWAGTWDTTEQKHYSISDWHVMSSIAGVGISPGLSTNLRDSPAHKNIPHPKQTYIS